MQKVLFIAGTRPEAIKLAPLLKELRSRGKLAPVFCATAQHRQLLDQALELFGLTPDFDLELMSPGQSLPELTSRLFAALPPVLQQVNPSAVIVQGDTTTAFSGAISSFYAGIPVAHVEAGLRSGNLAAPFPEEGNRRLIGCVAKWHFAATLHARQNLMQEGISTESIFVTGNTVVDALESLRDRIIVREDASRQIDSIKSYQDHVLVTAHRRESFGSGMQRICSALKAIAVQFPKVQIVFPVHPNPKVSTPVHHALAGQPNIALCEPMGYLDFLRSMSRARLIITDSGGVQEEAPSFGVPVLVMREVTERTEAVDAGWAQLVGTDENRIISSAGKILCDGFEPPALSNPFGDGHASSRIADVLERDLATKTC
jgi:UDP-N-acetylglucosamine 2-epimerase (non-hydrolysing)